MKTMTEDGPDDLVGEVMRDGGMTREVAARVVRATLSVLGERLTSDETEIVARALEPDLARLIRGSGYDSDFSASELYERVRQREGTTPGLAREHAQIALRAAFARLDEGGRRRLAHAVPEEIAALLEPRATPDLPPYAAASHAPPVRSLSTGRPGSRHPLSEARPPEGQSHSVVREDNPHGDTKLSSASGLTQERLGDALATGRPPGPERPLSQAHDEGAKRSGEGGGA